MVLRIVERAEHDHRGPARAAEQSQAVVVAEAHVEDQDIRRLAGAEDRSGFVEGATRRDDLDARLASEQRGRSVAEDRVVIDDGDADQPVADHSTPTCIPRSGRWSNSSRAPICSARWTMFSSP